MINFFPRHKNQNFLSIINLDSWEIKFIRIKNRILIGKKITALNKFPFSTINNKIVKMYLIELISREKRL